MTTATAVMPKIVLDQEKHVYTVEGIVRPGVTTLLKEYGIVNLDGIPPDRLEYKRVLGTAVDLACHLLNERNLDEESLSPKIVPYVDSYRRFCEVHGFEVSYSKFKVFSRVWNFCGELDMIGSLTHKGKFYKNALVDNKCTWTMYPSNGPQTAGYEIAWTEMTKIKIDGRFGLQLKPNGTFELYPYTCPRDRSVFLSCVTIHQFREKNGLLKKENGK